MKEILNKLKIQIKKITTSIGTRLPSLHTAPVHRRARVQAASPNKSSATKLNSQGRRKRKLEKRIFFPASSTEAWTTEEQGFIAIGGFEKGGGSLR